MEAVTVTQEGMEMLQQNLISASHSTVDSKTVSESVTNFKTYSILEKLKQPWGLNSTL